MFPGVRTANSQLLQALCEQGLIGLAGFAMVLGFWSHEVFDTLLLYPKVGLAYWAVVGIVLVVADRDRAGRHKLRALAPDSMGLTTGRHPR